MQRRSGQAQAAQLSAKTPVARAGPTSPPHLPAEKPRLHPFGVSCPGPELARRRGITNDPNRPDELQYILRFLAKVISVSLETVEIVERLPGLGIGEAEPAEDTPVT